MIAQASGSGEGAYKNVNCLLDSRATNHVTNDENHTPFLGDDSIIVGNGFSLPIIVMVLLVFSLKILGHFSITWSVACFPCVS